MKLINHLRSLFASPTILSTIKSEVPLEHKRIIECEDLIEKLQFQIALSEAKIVAMMNWQDQRSPNQLPLFKRKETHDDHSSY